MPANLSGLPQHILGDILRQLVSRDSPDYQPSIICVSSAFYLAAIPILYHSPRITTKIESFFLHKPIDPPRNLLDLSSAELLQLGLTKLAAFRHVRSLQIDLSEHPESPLPQNDQVDVGQGMAEEPISVPNFDPDKHIKPVDPWEIWPALPRSMMPNLAVVKVGEVKECDPRRPRLRQKVDEDVPVGDDYAVLVISQGALPRWCQHASGSTTLRSSPSFSLPSVLTVFPSRVGAGPNPVPSLHIHTHLFRDSPLIAGGTTYIYIHPRSTPHPDGVPDIPTAEITLKTVELRASWFSYHFRLLAMSIDRCPENRQQILDNTKIIVAGLFEPVPEADKIDGHANDEIRLSKDLIKMAKEMASDGEELRSEYLNAITIEIRRAEDMPDCPECGMGLGVWTGSDQHQEEFEQVDLHHSHPSPSSI